MPPVQVQVPTPTPRQCGAPAVRRMLDTLVEEMHLTLAHLGAASIAEVGRHCVEVDPRR